MKRRVVKHGPSTFIVSLPSKWVKRNNVQKGDELEVTDEGSALSINSQETPNEVVLRQDVEGLAPRLLDRFLARSYQKGYDKIYLIHNDVELLKVVQTKIHELIGFALMEQDEHMCLIQAVSKKIEIEFEPTLRKAFLLIKEMLISLVEAYEQGDIKTLWNIQLKDLQVNRLCYFLLRHMNKTYGEQGVAQQQHVIYYLVESLEDIGDFIKNAGIHFSKTKKRASIVKLLKQLLEQFSIVYAYYYGATKERANREYELYLELKAQFDDIVKGTLNDEECHALAHIRDTINIFHHFTTMRLDLIETKP